MFRVWVAAAGLAAALGGSALAAEQPRYGPVPAWVKPIPIPEPSHATNGAPNQLLLMDEQARYGQPDGDEFYSEFAGKISSAEILANSGNIIETWDPETETLTIHRLHVIRDGKVIDELAGGRKLTVMRRETNLESAMLDGRLTATLQLEGLRVGDIVDLAVSLSRKDPALAGRSEGAATTAHVGIASRIYVRQVWPASRPIRWKTSDDLAPPSVSTSDGQTELVYDLHDAVSAEAPKGAPARYSIIGLLQASQFRDWAEVSSVLAPLYAGAVELAPDSPLRAEAAKIKAAYADPKARAMAALRLVEDQVRYVFIGMNYGGFTPAKADLTWSRRFGDCKGKAVLLVALLRQLGIEAEPALVNTTLGDGMDQRLPMLETFDHVIVRVVIEGKVYWLDGTRLGDRHIEDLLTPDYHWALPVRGSGASLEPLAASDYRQPTQERRMRIDASAGPDKPAAAHLEEIYRGDGAVVLHATMAQFGPTDAERAMRSYWTGEYAWIKPDRVSFAFDDDSRVATLSMDGTAQLPWTDDGEGRDVMLDDSSLGWEASFKRDPGPHRDAPYAVAFPFYRTSTVTIVLPDKGAGFSILNGAPIDQRVAGVAYRRTSAIRDGVLRMEAVQHSVASEFPASDAAHAEQALREMSEHTVSLHYGSSAETADASLDAGDTPTDAEGFAARAAGYLSQGEYDKAIADFSQAIRLDPKSSKYVYDRGVAQLEAGRNELALKDFESALALNPKDSFARVGRAEVYLLKGDAAHAAQDVKAALAAVPDRSKLLLRIAKAYDQAGWLKEAAEYYDQWLAADPSAKDKSDVLDARCWAMARSGSKLEGALAACEEALKLQPESAEALRGRALVRLRQGRADLAISDFNRALAADADDQSALYGRGLAELRKGDKSEGDADIAAAEKLDPTIAETYSKFGVKR